jgi:hypothetical protein
VRICPLTVTSSQRLGPAELGTSLPLYRKTSFVNGPRSTLKKPLVTVTDCGPWVHSEVPPVWAFQMAKSMVNGPLLGTPKGSVRRP